jgi:dTDP-4-amino-4,6-dideoxygalactose transaminase
MKTRIPLVDLYAQYLSMKQELDDAVTAVVTKSAFVGTAGNEFVRRFEQEFAAYAGRSMCVACGNGTDALEILLQAAGIGPGDEVIVPALSWIATAEAVTTVGATPVFVDILPGEYTMNPAVAAARITSKTRAIIPVHLYGLPARIEEIAALAERHGLFLLEDCAQSHGARVRGRQAGTFGRAASYSFFPGKNLGAWGDAGGLVTDDAELGRKARMIAQHGQTDKKHDHQVEGRNSRMDGMQAAILSAKLRHLPAWTVTRQRIAAKYRDAFAGIVEGMQTVPDGYESVYHLMVLEVPHRDAVVDALVADGISAVIQYPTALPLLPAYARFGHTPEDFPVAAAVTRRIFSVPLYPELTDDQQRAVVDAVARAVSAAGRTTASS